MLQFIFQLWNRAEREASYEKGFGIVAAIFKNAARKIQNYYRKLTQKP